MLNFNLFKYTNIYVLIIESIENSKLMCGHYDTFLRVMVVLYSMNDTYLIKCIIYTYNLCHFPEPNIATQPESRHYNEL